MRHGNDRSRTEVAGFSLLELLMVLAVLGVLAGLAGSGAAALSRLASRSSDEALLRELVSACRFYRLQNGAWPDWLEDGCAELDPDLARWQEDLQPYVEIPLSGLFMESEADGRRFILLVDVDGDRWIPGTLLQTYTNAPLPDRLPGIALACVLDSAGVLRAATWSGHAE